MKECFKCLRIKPLSQFYRHSRMLDGHVNKCKECNKKDVQGNYRKRVLYYRKYDKARSQTENRKRQSREKLLKYRVKYPEKYKAHTLVHNAVRDGKLIKQPCEMCNNINSQAHHPDYSKPLDVVWLCVKHHCMVENRLAA